MSDTTLVVKKVINASKEEVFEAFTNPEIMAKWFCPADNIKIDVHNNLYPDGDYTS